MKYLYDMHVHTREGSDGSPLKDMVRYYHEMGYAGFCITDHFTGSSAVPEEASWEERVNRIWEVTDRASREAEKYGLSVFTGLEFSLRRDPERFLACTGNDFLFFNLRHDWLLENREVFDLPYIQMLKKVREAGVFVVHAHPFLEAPYMTHGIILCPRDVDAVEICNGHVSGECNARALWYSREYGLPATGGSDNHTPDRSCFAGVAVEKKCSAPEELIEAVKSGRAAPFCEKRV